MAISTKVLPYPEGFILSYRLRHRSTIKAQHDNKKKISYTVPGSIVLSRFRPTTAVLQETGTDTPQDKHKIK